MELSKVKWAMGHGLRKPHRILPFLLYQFEHLLGAERLLKPRKKTPRLEHPLTDPTTLWAKRAPGDLKKPHAVALKSDYAFVTGRFSGSLVVFDISDLSDISHVATVTGPQLAGAHGLSIEGDYAYVTCEQTAFDQTCGKSCRVTVVDITTPTSPAIVSSLQDTEHLKLVKRHDYHDGKLYCAVAGANALTVVDVSDPTAPAILGSVADSQSLRRANDAFYHDGRAYVAALKGGYVIADVSTPTDPEILGVLSADEMGGLKNSVVDDREVAYVTCMGSDRFITVDVSNPGNPTILDSVGSDQKTRFIDVAVDEPSDPTYSYVTNYLEKSLTVYDVSDPEELQEVSKLQRFFDLRDPQYLTYRDGAVYIAADGSDCLSVVA